MRAGDLDQLFDLPRGEAHKRECVVQNCTALLVGGAREHQDVGGPALDRRVERGQPVGAHDDGDRQLVRRDAIHTADQGVNAGAVLVVHLRRFARLRQGVGLVDQHHDAAARLAGRCLELGALGDRVIEHRRQQLGHLADPALAPRGQAQRKQRHVDLLGAGDGVADGFRKLRFAGANIAGEHDERGSAQDNRQQSCAFRVMRRMPAFQPGRVDQQAEDLGEPRLVIVQSDQPGVALRHHDVGEHRAAFEQIPDRRHNGHCHPLMLDRLSARPPDE